MVKNEGEALTVLLMPAAGAAGDEVDGFWVLLLFCACCFVCGTADGRPVNKV